MVLILILIYFEWRDTENQHYVLIIYDDVLFDSGHFFVYVAVCIIRKFNIYSSEVESKQVIAGPVTISLILF